MYRLVIGLQENISFKDKDRAQIYFDIEVITQRSLPHSQRASISLWDMDLNESLGWYDALEEDQDENLIAAMVTDQDMDHRIKFRALSPAERNFIANVLEDDARRLDTDIASLRVFRSIDQETRQDDRSSIIDRLQNVLTRQEHAITSRQNLALFIRRYHVVIHTPVLFGDQA